MAWEQRGPTRFYYRITKVSGRVCRQYCGSGTRAEQAAAEDARRREAREAARQARREDRRHWENALLTLRAVADVTDVVARATLMAAGYHRHDQGQWRLRRGS